MEKEKCGQLKDFFPFWEKLTAAEMESICRSAAEMTYSRGSFIHRASEDCVGAVSYTHLDVYKRQGKGLRSQVGTMYGTLKKGPRYLEMAEGYVTGIALDEEDQIIGYQFVSLGKMTDFIKKGDDPNTAYEKAKGQYGRVADAVKIIDPRKE